jgi:protein-S-isoprenylcysteine O-methyltransferase Ste14
MSTGENDIADVIARPPLILVAALLAGLICDYLFPSDYVARMYWVLRYLAAGVALLAGIVLLGAAANEMRKVGTSIPTWEPTLEIATEGVYGRSRNPIYLAFIWFMIAFALFFASDWTFVMIIPFVYVIHFGVILREERYLLARFGADYASYRARVPRYLFGI